MKGLTWYENISIFLFVYFLITLIDSIGKSYDLLTIPTLLLIFECLIMPSFVYNIYNDQESVIAFKYNMAVPLNEYYAYTLPATIAMIIGLHIPFIRQIDQTNILQKATQNCKTYLVGKSNIGIILIITGASSGLVSYLVPGELRYVFYLIGLLIIVGVLYMFYSDAKQKKAYLIGAIVFILGQSIAAGLFGDFVYLLLLGGLLVMLSYKPNPFYKFALAITGFLIIMLLQSIKHEYRSLTWIQNNEVNKSEAFANVVMSRINDPGKFIDRYALFPTVIRFNQGMIVSWVLEYVPRYAPFAKGETVINSTLATLVPRFLWSDKPKAGGQENMLRFTGLTIVGYSMNIGVIGEAYANYGKNGGIIFMFCFGLFFNLIFTAILYQSKYRPTIILWIPLIYIHAIQAETDLLMTVNSTIKNLLFVGICFWAFERLMRIRL
ncbi:MAG: hypothetical protein KGP35_00305 [Bacteroidetes bacterium]|nr:hypothetical protein [Bacteroidota bacterium]